MGGLLLCFSALARNGNIFINTRYENGLLVTEAHIESDTSLEIMHGIVSDINTRFRLVEIDSLEWAIKGLSGKEEGKNLIRIELKRIEYDHVTEIFDFFIDIYAGIMRKNFNVRVTVLLKSSSDSSILMELQNPNFFLKSAGGTLSVQQNDGKKQFVAHTSVRFGWLFNQFITISNYQSVAEWRIQTLLENLKSEANRRM